MSQNDPRITAVRLWDKYNVPEVKRNHMRLVARVALILAAELTSSLRNVSVDTVLLETAALLHDLDKNVVPLPGEQHPDTGVRILREEGMEKVADLVKTHPLHAILDKHLTPKTYEEKLLFLADKMVKHEIITVDKRFRLWNEEHLPHDEQKILDDSYPKVKLLESEIFNIINRKPDDVAGILTG